MTGSLSSGKNQKEKCTGTSSPLQHLPNAAAPLTSTNHCQMQLPKVPGSNQEAHHKYILNNSGAVLIFIAINHSLRHLHIYTLFTLPLPNKENHR